MGFVLPAATKRTQTHKEIRIPAVSVKKRLPKNAESNSNKLGWVRALGTGGRGVTPAVRL